jgi:hypothetical protein
LLVLSRLLVRAVLAAALLMSAAATAAATTPPPTLAGEAFNASMNVDDPSGATFPFILGQCGNWYSSTPTFDFSGQATGPYPGSFDEQGSVTYSSDAPSNNPWGQGPVLSFVSTFRITAPDGVTVSAVGTTSLVPNGDLAVCFGGAGGGGVNIGPFLTHYTATITNPDGTSSQDSGSSYLTLSQSVGLGEYWSASLIQSFFATPPPPPPTLTLSNLTATVNGSTVQVSVDTSPAIVNVTLEEGGAKVAPDATPVNGVASWTLTDLAPGTHTLAVQGWDSPSGQPGAHSGVQKVLVTVPAPPPPPPPAGPTPQPPVPTSASTPTAAGLGGSAPPVVSVTSTHITLLLPETLTIPRLLRARGYVWTLTAPEAGGVLVLWRRGRTLIARGQARFRQGGRTEVTIRLTAAGSRLLRTERSLRVAAYAIYTASDGSHVSRRQTLKLVR